MQHVNFLRELFHGSDELIEIVTGEYNKSQFIKLADAERLIIEPNTHICVGIYGRKHGRKGKKATAADCGNTGALFADYDHMKGPEVLLRIKAANLPDPSIITDSGNGTHCYWMLDKRAGDEALPVVKAIAKSTGADPKATDKARILRLPGSFNVKDPTNPKPCKVLHRNGIRYPLELFTKALEEAIPKKIEISCSDCMKNCVQTALNGVETGYRSWAMGSIIEWYKPTGKNRSEIYGIASEANARNNPPIGGSEFMRTFNTIWEGQYYFGACRYSNPESQKKVDRLCSAGSCQYHAKHFNEDCIAEEGRPATLDNAVFKPSVYPELSGDALAIYLTLLRIGEGVNVRQLSEALQRDKDAKSLRDSVNELRKFSHKGFKLIESKYIGRSLILRAIPTAEYNFNRGYTVIGGAYSELYLGHRITETEFKFMLLLKHNAHKKNVFTVDAMAGIIGIDPRALWRAVKKLESKAYIKRSQYLNDTKSITVFTLLL